MSTVTAETYFAVVPEWVIDVASPRALQLYAILRRYADEDGEAYPSRRTLADRAKCSTATIDRTLRELADIGAVTMTARFDAAGDRSSNLYYVHTMTTGGRTDEGTGGRVDGGTGGRVDAAVTRANMNQSHSEPDIATVVASAPLVKTGTAGKDVHDALVWALVDAMGWERDEVPEAQWGRLHRAAKDLANVGADPGDVQRRARIYQVNFRGATMTPNAIATNWPDLATPRPVVAGRDVTAAATRASAVDAVKHIEDTS